MYCTLPALGRDSAQLIILPSFQSYQWHIKLSIMWQASRSTHPLGKCPWTHVHGLVSITKWSGPPSCDVWWPNCRPMACGSPFHAVILPPFHASMPTHAASLAAQDHPPLHHRTAPRLPALTSSGDVLYSYLRRRRDVQGCARPRGCAAMGCKHQHHGQGGQILSQLCFSLVAYGGSRG